MNMQALITKAVIDSYDTAPHHGIMVTHDEIRDELIRQIDSGQVKQAAVARFLSIAPARIAEVRAGTRRIQPAEMPKLAEKLGLISRNITTTKAVESVHPVKNWGDVAQGVWLEQMPEDTNVDRHVAYDRMPGDTAPVDLFAVTPKGTSMNLAFMPGTDLICRKIGGGDEWVLDGDFVIVQRTQNGLFELTCKRVRRDGQGVFWLHSESDDMRYQEPWRIGKPDRDHHHDIEVSIIGIVIRAVQSFER